MRGGPSIRANVQLDMREKEEKDSTSFPELLPLGQKKEVGGTPCH